MSVQPMTYMGLTRFTYWSGTPWNIKRISPSPKQKKKEKEMPPFNNRKSDKMQKYNNIKYQCEDLQWKLVTSP